MTRVKGIANQLNRGTHEQDGASAELTRCVEQMGHLGLEVKNFAQEQRRDSSLIPRSVDIVAERIKEISLETKDQSRRADQIQEALEVFWGGDGADVATGGDHGRDGRLPVRSCGGSGTGDRSLQALGGRLRLGEDRAGPGQSAVTLEDPDVVELSFGETRDPAFDLMAQPAIVFERGDSA